VSEVGTVTAWASSRISSGLGWGRPGPPVPVFGNSGTLAERPPGSAEKACSARFMTVLSGGQDLPRWEGDPRKPLKALAPAL